ncbi:hypothetical protein PYW08_015850 [Mythimna loreyi]|uniref:Uncharacterized protein n=1 Tax=Mythimna loreyi TaxID=667449 RepID=A0ACC2QU29_9NEOP|nr:hypothetical protein PYW08_015850 [Mythimna loreyi]
MALKRLPNDVQSLLCASAQINNYKKAIEELIYNSLDAKSTSIAIRIHIQESTIQVIDNGIGIAKEDFNAIGQRYMTSKLTDLATLKAAPKNYGYRGEFISNIITVTQMVKITSRHEKTEETWAKTFIDGKEKKFAQMTTRPTMGTTNGNKNNNDDNVSIKNKAELIIPDQNNEQQIIQVAVDNSEKKKEIKTFVNSKHRKEKKVIHTYSIHDNHSEVNEDSIMSITTKDDCIDNSKNLNIVFVSKSQHRSKPSVLSCNAIVEPLDVCETVIDEIGSGEKEFAISFNENNQLNDSLYGNIKDGFEKHIESGRTTSNEGNDCVSDSVSHHFNCAEKIIQSNRIHNIIDENLQDPVVNNQEAKINIDPENILVRNINTVNMDSNIENNFNLKNRPRFLPKGMSQIFENCHNKTACVYDADKDYYEDSIYNNFANDVQVNSEIYEPIIQNIEDLTTKNIQKFQNKIKKDNASLVFDESSLKNAKVLGQADCKFIVAIMKKRCEQREEGSEYLILFDQHAVHERIRLEKNLADYLNEEGWTSVAVDNIVLKMSKDEILYLHNYKDKFTQLGLQWTISTDCEVIIHSIPEAILGKNPREVERVIKAVRNLVIEEINIIKLQKGCVSLYPKSIMDLVCSESCRYAIKFGDHLTKSDCVKLINDISNCKTPFQCAHGRPVMAVIMDIIPDKRTYKINSEALRRFKQRNTRKC